MARLTLDELIERLEDLRDDFTGDMPANVAYQPGYPLFSDLQDVHVFVNSDGEAELFFVAGSGGGYLASSVATELAERGWH